MSCNEDVNSQGPDRDLQKQEMQSMPLMRLSVKGLGHVPSFKNKKRAILDRATGKMRTLTDPDTQKWMENCIQSLRSQLYCKYLTGAGGTPMAHSLPSWIALSVPLDDSVQWILEITIKVVQVAKGDEGAILEITRLT